MKPTRD